MVYGLVLVVHILIAFFLIGVILLQGGRGGLGEALGGAGAQSLFGGGANIVMTKVTAVAAGMFMVTCLSLAALSTARGRSVIEQLPMTPEELPLTLPQVTDIEEPAAHAPQAGAPATPPSPTPSSSTPEPVSTTVSSETTNAAP